MGPRTRKRLSSRSFCFTAAWVRLVCPSNWTRERTELWCSIAIATLGAGVRQVFVIRIENGRGAYKFYPALRPGEQVSDVIPEMCDGAAAG